MPRGTLDTAVPPHLSCTGLSPSPAGLPRAVPFGLTVTSAVRTPQCFAPRFGLFPFRSPLLRESHFVFSSSGYLDVSVHRVCFQLGWMMQSLAPGCPIRKSVPHTGICPWTRLIAACHVLLRLREPRHPSCALFSFPFIFKESRLFTRHHLTCKQCFLRSSVGCAADGLLRRFELLPLFHYWNSAVTRSVCLDSMF